jgi:hypothetical protein
MLGDDEEDAPSLACLDARWFATFAANVVI